MKKYIEAFRASLEMIEVTDRQGKKIEFEPAVMAVIDLLTAAKAANNRLYFTGNGGSAGIAIHMAADFLKNGGMRAQSLHEASVLTCLGNDFGYEYVFSKQLDLLADQADVLVAISSSGNSANILNAVEAVRAKGGKVITFTGFKGDNQLRSKGDYNFYVPFCQYGIVESNHNFVLQMMVDLIVERDGVAMQ